MSVINKPFTFSPNTSISSSQINSNFDTIVNEFNGNISAANLATDSVTTAKIADSNVTTAKIADSSVTAVKLADGAVTGAKKTFDGAKAFHNTTQNIPNATDTTIIFNSESYDSGTYHDNTTNNSRLTVPATAKYRVGGLVNITGWDTTTARRLFLYFRINGTTVHKFLDFTFTSSTPAWSGTVDLNLTAADYVEFRIHQASNSARDLAGGDNNTAFWIERLGV